MGEVYLAHELFSPSLLINGLRIIDQRGAVNATELQRFVSFNAITLRATFHFWSAAS